MHGQDHEMYTNTPTLTVLDHRGLTVRDIAYHRHPDSPFVTNVRITRHHHDAGGFLSRSADPRLHVSGRVNFSHITGLNGSVLRAQGADNGTTVSLNDAAGRPLISVSNIRTIAGGADDRSQAVTSSLQYEDATLPGRPHSITERLSGEAARITERFVYAGSAAEEKAMNRAGACVSHYDTAGLVQTDCIALTGTPLSVTRHLLKEADNSDVVADWQGTGVPSWDALLDGDDEGYTTLTTADASGAMLTTTDSKDNLQRVAYDVAGRLWGSWLTLKNGTEQVIVASLTWSAAGQKLREVHGNGVVTTYTYDARTQRLTGMKTERPAGHPAGARVLQDLRYEYDPVGNVLKSTNDAEETRFWRNQKAVPENTYVYDSLYQLVSATGRETGSASQQDSNLPAATVPLPGDSSAFTNYTRTYTYDSAGNLTQVRHGAPATNNSYTTDITVSDKSNRGVLSTLTENPAEVDALFTAGGQQKQLQPGQSLVWTPRNELLKVTPVMRDGDVSDRESYRYDGGSQRILKISKQKTGSSTQTQRVVYLPGLELRTTTAGDTETEVLQVITVGEAGRAQVRVLHWLAGNPAEITGDQIRYSYDNLTGSSQLELDGEGQVISMEEYYPYGGTAVWTARSVMEAEYKTVRYSGKERDATGLYYYGYRYYQPWAGRWLSADPAGTVDGLNLFRMCRNNPLRYADEDGRKGNEPAFHSLLTLTKKMWDMPDVSDEQIMQEYHAMSLGGETIQTMSTAESLTQILRVQQIAEDAGRALSVYPQGRSNMTPLQLYTQSGESLTPADGAVGYYRFIAVGADRTQPSKSRLNITVKKNYISEMAAALAKLTMRNISVISQSKVTAYDHVGKVAESAVVYLNIASEAQARLIKDKFLSEFSQRLQGSGVTALDALADHPAVSMMGLEKGIHYKEISDKAAQTGQGSIAKGVSGIVMEAIMYGRQTPSASPKKALRHVLKEWGYSRSNPALVRSTPGMRWFHGRETF